MYVYMYVCMNVCQCRYREATETSGVEVEAAFLAFPDALMAGKDSLLQLFVDLYARTGKTWLFELDAVCVLLEYKWYVCMYMHVCK